MACDQCKIRRTKCTNDKPCAACIKSDIACTYRYIAKKKGPKGWVMATLRDETTKLQARAAGGTPGATSNGSNASTSSNGGGGGGGGVASTSSQQETTVAHHPGSFRQQQQSPIHHHHHQQRHQSMSIDHGSLPASSSTSIGGNMFGSFGMTPEPLRRHSEGCTPSQDATTTTTTTTTATTTAATTTSTTGGAPLSFFSFDAPEPSSTAQQQQQQEREAARDRSQSLALDSLSPRSHGALSLGAATSSSHHQPPPPPPHHHHNPFGSPAHQQHQSLPSIHQQQQPHHHGSSPHSTAPSLSTNSHAGGFDPFLSAAASAAGTNAAFTGFGPAGAEGSGVNEYDDRMDGATGGGGAAGDGPATLDLLGSLGSTFFPAGAPTGLDTDGSPPQTAALWAFQLAVPQAPPPISFQISPPHPPPSLSWLRVAFDSVLRPQLAIYFERCHPTIPFFDPAWFWARVERAEHVASADFAALVLAVAAFALVQPVQSTDPNCSIESRARQAVDLLDEALRLRPTVLLGDELSLETCIVSFFAFGILFGLQQSNAGYYRLKECLSIAQTLGLDSDHGTSGELAAAAAAAATDPELRAMRLRTYWILGVTERGFALQRNRPIVLKGRLSLAKMDPFAAPEHVSGADQLPYVQGLRRLARLFDAIDEDVVACWTRACKANASCRLRNPEAAATLHRELCQNFLAGVEHVVSPVQKADLLITQQWLRNRIWQLVFAHGLSDMKLEHRELGIEYTFEIAQRTVDICYESSQSALEPHGLGLVEKLYDISMTVIFVLSLCPQLASQPVYGSASASTPLDTLSTLAQFVSSFRRGDHPYEKPLTNAFDTLKHELWSAQAPPS